MSFILFIKQLLVNLKADVVNPHTINFARIRSSRERQANIKNIITPALKFISRISFFKH